MTQIKKQKVISTPVAALLPYSNLCILLKGKHNPAFSHPRLLLCLFVIYVKVIIYYLLYVYFSWDLALLLHVVIMYSFLIPYISISL
jgi:hypothetical protein